MPKGITAKTLTSIAVALAIGACSDDSGGPAAPPEPKAPPAPTATLELSSPPRGGMLSEGTTDTSLLTLGGTACDSTSTVAAVTINGVPVSLTGAPPCLAFSTMVDSRWGLNIVRGTATNEAGYTENLVQSYLRSPGYFAPETSPVSAPPAEKVPGGVYLQLNQELIDDGVRPSGSNLAEMDDLASLFNQILAGINLEAALPHPLVPGPGTKTCNCVWPIPDLSIHTGGALVERGSLDYSPLAVDYIDLVSGGFDASFSTGSATLPVTVTGYLGDCITSCVDRIDHRATVSGTVSVDGITIRPRVLVSLGAGGRVDVAMTGTDVDLDNLKLDIDWGLVEFLDGIIGLSNLTSNIVNAFGDDLRALIAQQIEDQIPPVLENFVESFEPPATVTLPHPMNTPLAFDTQFDLIDFNTNSARLGIAASVSPVNPLLTSPMGPIQRGGNVPSFATSPYAMGAGIKDDLLNQFLWAAWRGGALELSDVTALGCGVPEGVAVRMSATLPPVVMPGTGGHQVDIGLGDVYIETSVPQSGAAAAGRFEEGAVALYAAGVVGATITIEPGTDRLLVTLEENPEMAVQMLSAPADADLEALASEYAAVFECILGEVLQRIIGSYPVPSVPIGAVNLPGIPADTRWALEDGAVDRQDPYYTLTGDVTVE